MPTAITTIQASDLITNSRAVLNDNFASLNANKIETDYLDTDTNLTADSDTKLATQKAVRAYVLSGGVANASETVKGLVELATYAEVLARTTTGATGANLAISTTSLPSTLLSDYVVDTGAANAYVITPSPAITAYATGQIFSFRAVSANTTTSTLNVSGLGTRTIRKVGGGTVLAANDILAAQIVMVEYDGTNFQMLNAVGNEPEIIRKPKMQMMFAFEALARYSRTFIGGGVAALSTNGIDLQTSATGTSSAQMQTGGSLIADVSLESPLFSCSLAIQIMGTDVMFLVGINRVAVSGTALTFTDRHMGFKFLRASSGTVNLVATQADGVTETVSGTLTTLVVNDLLELIIKVNGTASVDYFWRKNGGALSAATNLTGNMPSGATMFDVFFTAITNRTVATNTQIMYSSATYER